jgi:DNA mismatch repair protein MutL
LVPVELESSISNIKGYIGKPEFARKTRGEQYFFVNGRFIKHPYLHHSIDQAFKELLPNDSYPSYFIYIETDPDRIDINIHPTKTEVNFQDQQHIYAIMKSAIRQALGKFSITPTIDFDVEQSLDFNQPDTKAPVRNPFEKTQSDYNPFDSKNTWQVNKQESQLDKTNKQHWEKLFDKGDDSQMGIQTDPDAMFPESEDPCTSSGTFQFGGKFIVTATRSGILLIDQKRAKERVLYDDFMLKMESGTAASQQELFPEQITFPLSDAEIIRELKGELELLGFKINELGKNTFVVSGVPVASVNNNIKELLEKMLDNYKKNLLDLNIDARSNLARAMAVNLSSKPMKAMKAEEMELLISQLFRSSLPETSPSGKKIISIISEEEIEKLFK